MTRLVQLTQDSEYHGPFCVEAVRALHDSDELWRLPDEAGSVVCTPSKHSAGGAQRPGAQRPEAPRPEGAPRPEAPPSWVAARQPGRRCSGGVILAEPLSPAGHPLG